MKYVDKLDTDGWTFKVGDVYSSPYQATHFKITKIEIDEESPDPENAMIYGYRVHPDDYSLKVVDPDYHEENEWHRAWYLNDSWGLETP